MKIRHILSTILIALPLAAGAQSITLGSCTTHDGGEYNGEMQGGKPSGKGKTVFPDGNIYEGDYFRGLRHGYGIFTFFDGERYEGDWYKDHQHGFGTYYFLNNNCLHVFHLVC